MKLQILCVSAAAAIILMTAQGAQAGPIGPGSCQTFGSQPGENFNTIPSGIPNSDVCRAMDPGGSYVDLSFTGRFANPNPTNDGAGNFHAATGGDTLDARPDLFTFNDDFGVHNGGLAPIFARIFLDTANAADTDQSSMAMIQFLLAPGQTFGDSENAAFAFLRTGAPGVTGSGTMPDVNAGGQFDLMAQLLYALPGTDNIGFRAGDVFLSANTRLTTGDGPVNQAPVPEPATLTLMGSAFIGLGIKYRNRLKKQKAA